MPTRRHAKDLIAALDLAPHPEGGWFRETYRAAGDGRGAVTTIYYLLEAGQHSAWHRIDATEIWHFYDGDPLRLTLSDDGVGTRDILLGRDTAAGQTHHAVVPPHAWQSAHPTGDWTLVGCTVAPAFTFDGFEMAAPGWSPGGSA